MSKRLWLWVRTRPMKGLNPLYSPSLHMKIVTREAMALMRSAIINYHEANANVHEAQANLHRARAERLKR